MEKKVQSVPDSFKFNQDGKIKEIPQKGGVRTPGPIARKRGQGIGRLLTEGTALCHDPKEKQEGGGGGRSWTKEKKTRYRKKSARNQNKSNRVKKHLLAVGVKKGKVGYRDKNERSVGVKERKITSSGVTKNNAKQKTVHVSGA